MESQTFSTLPIISKKYNIQLNKLISNKDSVNARKINFNGEILYNEGDIIVKIVKKRKYLYIRYDTDEQLNELKDKQMDEFKENFPDYSVVVGVSNNNEINQSLLFLLRLCSRQDIGRLAFYDRNTVGRELRNIIEIIAFQAGVILECYKYDKIDKSD